MPNLIAFDTATEHLFVGLRVGDRTWLHEGTGGAQASATLIPVVLDLLARAGTELGRLDAVAFGRGPGAFTGLRTAASVAQGLAFGAGLPVIAIDSLMATAEDARDSALPATTWVAMDARMNEIYAALYDFDGTGWRTLAAPALYGPAELEARWVEAPPTRIAGNAWNAFPGLASGFVDCAQDDGGSVRRVPTALPRPQALLALAAAAWERGDVVDAALALPTYVRDKVAQTTAERDAARRLKDGLVMHGDSRAAP